MLSVDKREVMVCRGYSYEQSFILFDSASTEEETKLSILLGHRLTGGHSLSVSYLEEKDFLKELEDRGIPLKYASDEDKAAINAFRENLCPEYPETHTYEGTKRSYLF